MRYAALAVMLFLVISNTLVLGWMWERYGWTSNLWWNVAGIGVPIVLLGRLTLVG